MEKSWRFTGDAIETDYGTLYRIQSNEDINLKNGKVLIRELGGHIDDECSLHNAWLDEDSLAYGADIKDGTVIKNSEVDYALLSNCLIEDSYIVYDCYIIDVRIINSSVKGDGSVAITGEYINKTVEVKDGRMDVKDCIKE